MIYYIKSGAGYLINFSRVNSERPIPCMATRKRDAKKYTSLDEVTADSKKLYKLGYSVYIELTEE